MTNNKTNPSDMREAFEEWAEDSDMNMESAFASGAWEGWQAAYQHKPAKKLSITELARLHGFEEVSEDDKRRNLLGAGIDISLEPRHVQKVPKIEHSSKTCSSHEHIIEAAKKAIGEVLFTEFGFVSSGNYGSIVEAVLKEIGHKPAIVYDETPRNLQIAIEYINCFAENLYMDESGVLQVKDQAVAGNLLDMSYQWVKALTQKDESLGGEVMKTKINIPESEYSYRKFTNDKIINFISDGTALIPIEVTKNGINISFTLVVSEEGEYLQPFISVELMDMSLEEVLCQAAKDLLPYIGTIILKVNDNDQI